MMDLYGVGDHGGGPTRAVLDQGDHWAAPAMPPQVAPNMSLGLRRRGSRRWRSRLRRRARSGITSRLRRGTRRRRCRRSTGRWRFPRGRASSILNITAESSLRKPTTSGACARPRLRCWMQRSGRRLAWLDGQKYPGAELTEDWKKVLFNQFHDLAAGSGIGVIYKDAQKDYDVVRWSTNEISSGGAGYGRRAGSTLTEHGSSGGGVQPAGLGAIGRSDGEGAVAAIRRGLAVTILTNRADECFTVARRSKDRRAEARVHVQMFRRWAIRCSRRTRRYKAA